MFFAWLKRKLRRILYNIEVKLDIDTIEGWFRNGLAVSTGLSIFIVSFCVGLGLLICKLIGKF